jgi:hypothetical protein
MQVIPFPPTNKKNLKSGTSACATNQKTIRCGKWLLFSDNGKNIDPFKMRDIIYFTTMKLLL